VQAVPVIGGYAREYANMQVELDREAVRHFVIFRHPDLPPRRDVPPRVDPLEVAELASKLASRVLGGVCDGDQCRVAECAGLLIYGMDGYGLNYEEICQLACRRVAEVLRQVTPDHRQTDPKRHLDLMNYVGQADALTLVVKLAEIVLVAEAIPKLYNPDKLASRALDLKNWVDRTHHILTAMRALKELPRVQRTLDRAHAALTHVAQLAEQAKTQRRVRNEANEQMQGGPRGRPGSAHGTRSRSLDRGTALVG
jgi:hypothetical protein